MSIKLYSVIYYI